VDAVESGEFECAFAVVELVVEVVEASEAWESSIPGMMGKRRRVQG